MIAAKKEKYTNICVVLLLLYSFFNFAISKLLSINYTVMSVLLIASSFFLIVKKSKCKIYDSKQKNRTILFASWIAIAIFMILHNVDLENTLLKGGYIQLCVMIMFLIFLHDETEWINIFVKWIKISALIYAVFTIFFYIFPSAYIAYVMYMYNVETANALISSYGGGWNAGLCSHFSSNGMLLAFGMIVCVEQFSLRDRKDNKFWQYLILFIIAYGLILSSKRSPLIASMCGLCFSFIMVSKHNYFSRLLKTLGILCTAFVIFLVLSTFISGMDTITNKFESTRKEGDVMQGRDVLWNFGMRIYESNPFFGGGYGAYKEAAERINLFTSTAHNEYIQILCEFGIFGMILYSVAFTSVFFMTTSLLRKSLSLRSRNKAKIIHSIKLSLDFQIFFLIYSITASTLEYYSIMIPYFIAITIPCAIHNKYIHNEDRNTHIHKHH